MMVKRPSQSIEKRFLRVQYRLERTMWSEPDEDQLDHWQVFLEDGTEADLDEDTGWQMAGIGSLYLLDPERSASVGQHPFDVADAHSADVEYYYSMIFDRQGHMNEEARAEFEWVTDRALILDDVRVPEALRRQGLGSLLAAESILTLAPHGTAVFAHPGPTVLATDNETERIRAETANTRFLAHLGFRPFHRQMWSLDVSAGPASETLAGLRREPRPS